MVLTVAEKVFIVEHYFRSYGNGRGNGPSLNEVADAFRTKFMKQTPSNAVLLSVVDKFRRTGSVLCQRKGHVGRPVTVTTNRNHGRVLNQVLHSPERSLRRSSLKLNISDRSLRRMFKNIGGFAYKIQTGQRLTAADKRGRVEYCARLMATDYVDASFLSNVWFSDESHIHLSGYINKQTTRFLGFERPDIINEHPLHSDRVTIWCAVSAHGILGPYFIEDDDGIPLTVNQERYRQLIITPFLHDLQRFCRARNLPLNQQWFQQDGATCHTARESLRMLRNHFGNRLISRGTDFPYPSHSPDLTPPDAYIWGMLKEAVFRSDPPSDIPELRVKIRRFFRAMQQPVFTDMFMNLRERYECCLELNGGHLEHLFYRERRRRE